MSQTSTHSDPLQHHFSDLQQQQESAKIGMWIFLLTEVLMFGGLFVAYTVFRALNPQMFINAHHALDVELGTLNTIVLITSSLTMALAIRFLQVDRKDWSFRLLIATVILAGCFLIVKYFEYSHKFHVGQLPGKYYTYEGIEGTDPHIFFGIYFMMTGLHGLHVMIGMVLILWLAWRLKQGRFSSAYYTPVENVGLFWHLVDMIWIFLFPLFYLIG